MNFFDFPDSPPRGCPKNQNSL